MSLPEYEKEPIVNRKPSSYRLYPLTVFSLGLVCPLIHEIIIPTIPDQWVVNARRRILQGTQTIRPAILKTVSKAVTTKGGNDLRTDIQDNGDMESHWEQPVTLIIDEFLNELGEIPKLITPREITINHVLPQFTSPIFSDFKVNLGADPFTQQIQKLLGSIYELHHTSVCLRLEIVQRAYWVDLSKKFAYIIRARMEMEKNFLGYKIHSKHNLITIWAESVALLVLLALL